MKMNPAPGDVMIDLRQVEGRPHPTELAQWLPDEEKWMTERALRSRGGLDDLRVTGCFLKPVGERWSFRVFTSEERDHIFGKPGTGTIPPTPT